VHDNQAIQAIVHAITFFDNLKLLKFIHIMLV